jgi:hypothetical protein
MLRYRAEQLRDTLREWFRSTEEREAEATLAENEERKQLLRKRTQILLGLTVPRVTSATGVDSTLFTIGEHPLTGYMRTAATTTASKDHAIWDSKSSLFQPRNSSV